MDIVCWSITSTMPLARMVFISLLAHVDIVYRVQAIIVRRENVAEKMKNKLNPMRINRTTTASLFLLFLLRFCCFCKIEETKVE